MNVLLPATSVQPDSLLRALEGVLTSEDLGPGFRARLERTVPFLEAEYDEAFAPGGYLQEAIAQAPWLSWRGERLRAEHRRLVHGLRELLRRLRRETPDQPAPQLLRRRLAAQLRALRRDEARLLLDAQLEELGEAG